MGKHAILIIVCVTIVAVLAVIGTVSVMISRHETDQATACMQAGGTWLPGSGKWNDDLCIARGLS